MKQSAMRQQSAAKVLAIETSTELLGVALVDDTGVRCEFRVVEPMIHSKMLLPLYTQALETLNWTPEDLDCLAVSAGPGSFTGLRIGFAIAQGLAFALDKPVAKVPTFQVYLRQCCFCPRLGIVQGRARSQTVCGLYQKASPDVSLSGDLGAWGSGSDFEEILPPTSMEPDRFLHYLVDYLGDAALGPVWITGDAAEQFCRTAREAGIKGIIPVDRYLTLPSPGIVGVIGVRMFLEGKTVPAAQALPDYYRKSQAEAVLARKEKKGD